MGKRNSRKKEPIREDEEFFITPVPGQSPDKGQAENEDVEADLDELEQMASDPDSIEGLMDQLVEEVKSAYPEPDAPIVTDGSMYDSRKDTYDDEIVLQILNDLEDEVAEEDGAPEKKERRDSVSLTTGSSDEIEGGQESDTNGHANGQGQGYTNGLGGRRNGFTNGIGRTNGFTNGRGRTNGLTNGSGRGRTNGLTNGSGRGRTNGLRGRTNGLTNGVKGRTNGLTNGTGRTNGFTNGRGRTNGLTNGSGYGRTNGLTNGVRGRTNGITNGVRGRTNGLTNGTGRTNGFTNGYGRTNGMTNGVHVGHTNGLINGTAGLTNGLSRPRFVGDRKNRKRLKKSHRYIVTVAMIIVCLLLLPVLYVLIVPETAPPRLIEVDGTFDDWSKAVVYDESLSITDPALDIVDFSIATDPNTVYGYIRTRGDMMARPQIDRFYIFIDSDNNRGTGYTMEDLGADYVVEVNGWNRSEFSAESRSFAGQDQLNWSAFGNPASGSLKVSGARVEFGVHIDTTLAPGDFRAKFASASNNNTGKICAPTVDGLNGALVIQQNPLDTDGIVSSSSVMSLNVRATGKDVTLNGIEMESLGASATVSGLDSSVVMRKGDSSILTVNWNLAGLAAGTHVRTGVQSVNATAPYSLIGAGLSAYAFSAPSQIAIDGAFADWNAIPKVSDPAGDSRNPSLDILEHAGAKDTGNLYTYVKFNSVGGSMEGAFSPVSKVRSAPAPPTNGTANGTTNGTTPVTPVRIPRLTGEDVTRIYIDSVFGGSQIGNISADYFIEIKGYGGKVTSKRLFGYPGKQLIGEVSAETGGSRLETGVPLSMIGSPAGQTRMYIETTDWQGMVDRTDEFQPTTASTKGVASGDLVRNGEVPWPEPKATPLTAISRAVDSVTVSAAIDNGAVDMPNGISYAYLTAKSWALTVSVGTFGWTGNQQGITVEGRGGWTKGVTYGQASYDIGSVWDAYTIGDAAVMVYEVFNTNTTDQRNYTCIFEQQLVVTSTNFGSTTGLAPINNPNIAWTAEGNSTCGITIAQQVGGVEVATLLDGYRVYKSTTGPITQSNQGVALGDATLMGGSYWQYIDPAFTTTSYYAVKVKWDGGTYPFAAPVYSYGMSNDVIAIFDAFSTATGPTNVVPSSVASVTLTYTYAGSPTSVNIYYTTNGGTTWSLAGNDASVDGSFSWTIPADGTYGWIAQAVGGGSSEVSPPTSGTTPEAASYTLDTAAPTSSVNVISPYWTKSSPITITATATDGAGTLSYCELWYRTGTDNATWGAWTKYSQNATTFPPTYSFTFSSQGYYQFYSRAGDTAGNYEASPATPPDTACAYDTTQPISSVNLIAPYWHIYSPLSITATVTDNLGPGALAYCELWYRSSADNSSWGAWTKWTQNATAFPPSYSFSFPSGAGYYQFYSRAADKASNYELAPAVADTTCAYSLTAPSSSVDTITPYWHRIAPITVTATATDPLGPTALAWCALWYRFSSDNSSWGAWTEFANATAFPPSYPFTFPSGQGFYQFYSRAGNRLGLAESAPASEDARCAYDTTPPTSQFNTIAPYWQTASPIALTATVSDNFGAGAIAYLETWYRFSSDNSSFGAWTKFATNLTAGPWLVPFNFPSGAGYYQLYSRAGDRAGNYESAPASMDTPCAYATAAPSSSIDTIVPYWRGLSPATITATASDPLGPSALDWVALWYRSSADNSTWGAWTQFPTNLTSVPWQWSFSFPDGQGYYQFYSRAGNHAGLTETPPLNEDASCAYDETPPSSVVNTVDPYWRNASPIAISATVTDNLGPGALAYCELWYRSSADNSSWGAWTKWTQNATAFPPSYSFSFPSGAGYYQFYSRAADKASNYELAPAVADTTCAYSLTAPSSSVDTITPYWHRIAPITVTATATDPLGPTALAWCALWYRFSSDNSSWGAWTEFANATAFPPSYPFTFPSGQGFYQFYSRAGNRLGLAESAPASEDARCAYDTTPPTSQFNTIAPYWQTASPIALTATVSDNFGAGAIAYLETWYRFSSDNSSFGAWTKFATNLTAGPWLVPFNFPSGAGYYQFYSRAGDRAGNYESAPASMDTPCAYSTAGPTSSVDTIIPYWTSTTPQAVTVTATDPLGPGALFSCALWYRTSPNNVTWGVWTLYGTATTFPPVFSFTFPIQGYYGFYSRATNKAGLVESIPMSEDARCAYDTVAPRSRANTITPYWNAATQITVTATVSDNLFTPALSRCELWYRTGTDNTTWGTWTQYAPDQTSFPPSFAFTFPAEGYYQYYTRAADRAGNYETAPAVPDTICAHDITPPASAVDMIDPYVQSAPVDLYVTVTDNLGDGAIDYCEIWYRFSLDNSTWTVDWNYYDDLVFPTPSYYFDFPDGLGYYEFYTRAYDKAGNYEDAPLVKDTSCLYNDISATATGPSGIGSDPRPVITYDYTGSPTSVDIYYTMDDGDTWVYWGTDATVDGTWTPGSDLPSSGTYNWNARARGTFDEPVPTTADDIEAGPYVLTIVVPEFGSALLAMLSILGFVMAVIWKRKRRTCSE
jgi:hypothetical protein